MNTITIQQALELNKEDTIFVDVRSPKEYTEDHILGAVNMPLLDDEERAIIGTLYKQEGKAQAVDKGYEYVAPKLDQLRQELEKLTSAYKNVIIYCFRGGMRSGSVVEFAKSHKLNVQKLENGYKSYRNFVLEYLQNIQEQFKFVVLHGNTCVGKTDILTELQKQGLNTIDLEYLAKNSGSVFGDIYYNDEKVNQKYFESQLFSKLKSYEKTSDKLIYMESESRKIGRCYLSKEFWQMMQEAHHILVTANIESRVQRSVHDYSLKSNNCDKALIDSVYKLKDSLGTQTVKSMEQKILEKDYAYTAKYLMENYYDRLYEHSEKKYQYELAIDSGKLDESVKAVLAWHQKQK